MNLAKVPAKLTFNVTARDVWKYAYSAARLDQVGSRKHRSKALARALEIALGSCDKLAERPAGYVLQRMHAKREWARRRDEFAHVNCRCTPSPFGDAVPYASEPSPMPFPWSAGDEIPLDKRK